MKSSRALDRATRDTTARVEDRSGFADGHFDHGNRINSDHCVFLVEGGTQVRDGSDAIEHQTQEGNELHHLERCDVSDVLVRVVYSTIE